MPQILDRSERGRELIGAAIPDHGHAGQARSGEVVAVPRSSDHDHSGITMGDLLQKPEQRKPPTALDAGPSRHAIVMGRRLRAELADGYGWDRPLSVIPHGTDAVRFRPARDKVERAEARARYGLGEEGRTWLFMGEAVKGPREFIAQMPMFPQVCLLVLTRWWRAKWAAWRCDSADMPC